MAHLFEHTLFSERHTRVLKQAYDIQELNDEGAAEDFERRYPMAVDEQQITAVYLAAKNFYQMMPTSVLHTLRDTTGIAQYVQTNQAPELNAVLQTLVAEYGLVVANQGPDDQDPDYFTLTEHNCPSMDAMMRKVVQYLALKMRLRVADEMDYDGNATK